MAVLITGGAGYIGSHTVLALLAEQYEVVVLDNLCNSSPYVLPRLRAVSACDVPFYQGDIRDRELLRRIFAEHSIDCVMHFAGLKAVGESVAYPQKYYDNNVVGSLILLEEMERAGVRKMVFSSSATVYGDPQVVPITETMPTGATTNPYGTSKYMVERILQDMQTANPEWSMIILRYFNPIGAHESGQLGEQPNGIPNNLLPYVSQVAAGKLPYLSVFGDDYPTVDGTGVRDYIHVVDLAEGHVCAMKAKSGEQGVHIYNLGTGQGYSVLQIVQAFEQATGQSVAYQIKPRRAGDIAVCYADAQKMQQETGWQAKRSLMDMMVDTWRWQSQNPDGFVDSVNP